MNFSSSLLAGLQAGQKNYDRQEARSKLAQLQDLAPRIMSGDAGAYAQAVGVDPTAAGKYHDAAGKLGMSLQNYSRYIEETRKTGSPTALNRAWGEGASLRQQVMGPGYVDTPEYNDDAYQGMRARGAMFGTDSASGTLQSQKIGDDGFIYNTFRDGRMVNTGVKADRQMWFRDHPGMDPQLVGKDGSVQTVGMAQTGTAMAPAAAGQPQRADMEADIELANSMIAAGIPEAQVDAFLAQRGQRASAAAPVAAPSGYGAPAGGSLARPSPAQEAAATERARLQAQAEYLPQELAMRTDAAIREADGKAAVEAAAKRQAVQADNDRSFSLYDTAMKGVSEGLDSAMTGPLAGRLPAVTAGQQIAEGGVAAIAPVLKQLFRSAGEGTFTDKDQELLLSMIPTRTDLPEARRWKIENIDRIVREKLGQPPKGGGGGAPPAAGGRRTIVRTGTSNGRKVIQYSDGSVEYGD